VVRAGIWVAESSNVWCQEATKAEFVTRDRCWAAPGAVEAGQRYRVTVTVKERWVDRTIDTGVPGFGPGGMTFAGNLLAPLRRSLSGQWFQPMVKIVPEHGWFAVVPLEMQRADVAEAQYLAQFTAPKSGRLYFFVNDVVLPEWVGRVDSYTNNVGSATIDVTPVRPRR
jgi:hypothetical protein